ncbi:hypothetical protein C2E19_12275 [Pseudomonas sp. DTU12.3]|uniref:hypothetical protein n=1 Tax=Pseudomonas sp. DTU12.3 TaxID=2073078 RepID=UPI0010121C47|nr:hypothetical protein [Pseudomonas sp. DTU12.3]QAX84593.1 hypothetical protein C2E19_12275 [Pseudomonas sp. DTU12.3]
MTKIHFSNNIESFSEICVNDSLDGDTVTSIALSHPDYIVYRSNTTLRYYSKNISVSATTKLSELSVLQAKSFRKFNNIHSNITDGHVLAVLAEILGCDCSNEETAQKIDKELKKFTTFIETEPAPTLIIISNQNYTIYLDEKNIANYKLQNKSLQHADILDEFYRLRAWGVAVLPKSKIQLLNLKLATCLAIGFRSRLAESTTESSNIFSAVTAYIEKSTNDSATYYLTFYSIIFSAIVMVATAVAYVKFSNLASQNLNILLIGLFGGACGALISVLQRSKKLKVDLYESTKMIVLQGIVRIGLGCAFGAIALVACKAGLLLELMSETNSRLLILAVIAGFSERLIPDFIEKTANERKETTS